MIRKNIFFQANLILLVLSLMISGTVPKAAIALAHDPFLIQISLESSAEEAQLKASGVQIHARVYSQDGRISVLSFAVDEQIEILLENNYSVRVLDDRVTIG